MNASSSGDCNWPRRKRATNNRAMNGYAIGIPISQFSYGSATFVVIPYPCQFSSQNFNNDTDTENELKTQVENFDL
ncbi:hypothetical protein SUGI_0843450 [Cryptomeria japonica]|nr:hypothetical protein SUGI_0843450 [Cryptomeria japonica]